MTEGTARKIVALARRANVRPGTAELFTTVREAVKTQQGARNLFLDATTGHGSTNLWQRTIGTQYQKSEANPTTFKPVFEAVQDFIRDGTLFANAAAERAPSILQKLSTLKDVVRKDTPRADIDAAGHAALAGSLRWGRDENGQLVDNDDAKKRAEGMTSDQKARVLFKAGLVTEAELKRWQATPLDIYDGAVRNRYEIALLRPGVVFSDAELADKFKLSEKQIGLYREFRAAIDQSLDDLGRSELIRLAGKTGEAVASDATQADTMAEAARILSDHIDGLTEGEPSAKERESLTETRNAINEKANQIERLKKEGYAPAMRFGQHTVTVEGANKGDDPQFFNMYESSLAANLAVRELRSEFPDAKITQGQMSQRQYELFQGMDMNALELFAETTGNADNAVYQDFLRLTKNNHSAMKRMIQRKGIAGWSENTARILASFVTCLRRHFSKRGFFRNRINDDAHRKIGNRWRHIIFNWC